MDHGVVAAFMDEIDQFLQIRKGKLAEDLGAYHGAGGHRLGNSGGQADFHRNRRVVLAGLERDPAQLVDGFRVLAAHLEHLVDADKEECQGEGTHDAGRAADDAVGILLQVLHCLHVHGEAPVFQGVGRPELADLAHIGDGRLEQVDGIVVRAYHLRAHCLGPSEKVGENAQAIVAEALVGGHLRLRDGNGIGIELRDLATVYARYAVCDIRVAGHAVGTLALSDCCRTLDRSQLVT